MTMRMKKKVLITGANGFIGTRLVEKLERSGINVVKLDRSLLTKPRALARLIKNERPSAIYHLAAYGNNYGKNDVRKIFQANLLGTFNLLYASSRANLESFINVGSSSEYGKKNEPMSESMSLETDTFYGATKAGANYLARAFARQFKLPIVSVRPFSVYGPGEASHRFIPTIIKSCLSGKKMPLAPGVHDWIYIDDFIDGMLLVAKNAKKLAGEVINIGCGKQYSNHEIVEIVENILGVDCPVEETRFLRSFDTSLTWVADNSRLCALGWAPKYDIYSGIKETITCLRNKSTTGEELLS